MNLLGAFPPAEILEPLERIFRQALVRGAPRPYGVVVEDSQGVWMTTLAGLSNESRGATVLVVSSPSALALAARWSVGGGVSLPPSTAGMSEALTAAREFSGRSTWMTDPVVLREIGECRDTIRVTPIPGELWHRMVGYSRTVEYLVELAKLLEHDPLIDDQPSLLIPRLAEKTVQQAWAQVENRPVWADDRAIDISPAATGKAEPDAAGAPSGTWAVVEIPSGRDVGYWAFDEGQGGDGPGVTLFLESGGEWVLDDGEGGRTTVPEVVDPIRLAESDSAVVRLPGWLTRDIERPGSPGAVLAKSVARESARLGMVLWVPGVTQKSLHHVMRLEGRIWVDGPVVPDPRSAG